MRPRRKRRTNAEQGLEEIAKTNAMPEPEPEPEPARPTDELPEGSQRVVISFFLNEKGEVDTERMRESMRKRIDEVFPAMKKQFAPNDSQQIPAAPKIPPSFVSTMFDGLGALQAMIFQRVLEIDEQTARQVFIYSEAEKQQLIPLAVVVLEKRMPEWLLKYKDEFALLALISMTLIAKVQTAKAIHEMRVTMGTSPAVPEHGPNGAAKQTPPATSEPAGGDEKEAA